MQRQAEHHLCTCSCCFSLQQVISAPYCTSKNWMASSRHPEASQEDCLQCCTLTTWHSFSFFFFFFKVSLSHGEGGLYNEFWMRRQPADINSKWHTTHCSLIMLYKGKIWFLLRARISMKRTVSVNTDCVWTLAWVLFVASHNPRWLCDRRNWKERMRQNVQSVSSVATQHIISRVSGWNVKALFVKSPAPDECISLPPLSHVGFTVNSTTRRKWKIMSAIWNVVLNAPHRSCSIFLAAFTNTIKLEVGRGCDLHSRHHMGCYHFLLQFIVLAKQCSCRRNKNGEDGGETISSCPAW